jgi:uncharacterized OB-fold protein
VVAVVDLDEEGARMIGDAEARPRTQVGMRVRAVPAR